MEGFIFFAATIGVPLFAALCWAAILWAMRQDRAAIFLAGTAIAGIPIAIAVAFMSFMVIATLFPDNPDSFFADVGTFLFAAFCVFPLTYWLTLAYGWMHADG